VGAITRGERRVGWGASSPGSSACGRRGRGAGELAHLEDVITWSTIVSLGLVWTTPLTFAAIGGWSPSAAASVNIGLEG
jgi:hypothetical protein